MELYLWIGGVRLKCEKCFEEWSIQDLGDRMVKFCPFCGAEYKEKEPDGFSLIWTPKVRQKN